MSFSILEKIADSLTFCKQCSLSCCNTNNVDSGIKVERKDRHYSMTNVIDREALFNFDRDYEVRRNSITETFCEEDVDIGKFITDIDGMCIYINEKGAEHLGKNVDDIRYSLIWTHNLYNEDAFNVSRLWTIALEEEAPILYTERRIIKYNIVYLIIEAYPEFSGNRCKGMRGIIIRTIKPVWFNFRKELLNNRQLANKYRDGTPQKKINKTIQREDKSDHKHSDAKAKRKK
jgi:PAS domain-containing protein